MKSLIQAVKGKRPVNIDHLSKIYGTRLVPKPTYYRHKETGQEFSHITGAFVWPGKEKAGFAIIVGVEKSNEVRPAFFVLDEAEEKNLNSLLWSCMRLREKWGFECGDILRVWWGDPSKFLTFYSEFNNSLREKHKGDADHGFHISAFFDLDKPDAFEIYLRRIYSFLSVDEEGKKRLYFGKCDKIRSHLSNLPPDAAKKSIEDFPSVAALGGLIHTLSVLQPWMKQAEEEKRPSPYKDDYVAYAAREQELALRDLYGPPDWESDFDETGEMISTVDHRRRT